MRHFYIFNLCHTLMISLMIAYPVRAQLDPKMFKGITQYFHPHRTHYSPVIGMASLESKIIEMKRLYGMELAYKEEHDEQRVTFLNRNYKADKLIQINNHLDAIGSLVYAVFHSPAGFLAPHQGRAPIKTFDQISTPEKVAALLNYVQELTDLYLDNSLILSQKQKKKSLEVAKQKLNQILGTEAKTDLRLLTNAISKALEQEFFISSDQNFLYPKYSTQQILLTYFCYKFNYQEDIFIFLNALNDQIIDPSKRFSLQNRLNNRNEQNKFVEDLLTQEDLADISKKPFYDLDDIYALNHGKIFENRIVPYQTEFPILGNGSAEVYNRRHNLVLPTTFSDCAETVAREILNLFFERINNQFVLSKLEHRLSKTQKSSKNFEALKNFYDHQTSQQVNNGSIKMRTLFNTVIGDLNELSDPIKVRYIRSINTLSGPVEYELDPGIMNLLRAFEKIFQLPLGSPSSTTLKDKKEWVKTSFNTLFTFLNPAYNYELDSYFLEDDTDDLQGNLLITVNNALKQNKLFSFTLYAKSRKHTDIQSLEVFQENNTNEIYLKYLKSNPMVDLTYTQENIWLTNSDHDLIKLKVHQPLYVLFSDKLEDNNSKINFIKKLSQFCDPQQIALNLIEKQHLKHIVKNVFQSLSWQDQDVVSKISDVVKSLSKLKNIQQIFPIDQVDRIYHKGELKDLEFFTSSLKSIHIIRAKTLNLRLKSSDFPLLEEFNYGSDNLREITIENSMPHLKELTLRSDDLTVLNNLENIPNLEKLVIKQYYENSTDESQSFNFEKEMKSLKHLDLEFEKPLENFLYIPNLQFLFIRNSVTTELNFEKEMPFLETLDIGTPVLQKLTNINNLPVLKRLNVSSFILTELDIKNIMPHLEYLRVTSVGELTAFPYLPSLKSLDISDNDLITEISFKNPLLYLETINALHSSIKILKLFSELPNLREVDLSRSSLKCLEDLSYAKNLKKLDLSDCKNIEAITFTQDNKDLKILLKFSNVNRDNFKNIIKGWEHLDESKLIF